MEEIIQLDSVEKYNQLRGITTQHPLVSVYDLAKVKPMPAGRYNSGLYIIFFKEMKCGEFRYGRDYYDYQDGTLIFVGPGQIMGVERKRPIMDFKGWSVTFHPDLISGTSLGKHMNEYEFFSYDVNEALHLSENEKQIVADCFAKIRQELDLPVDRHSRTLINSNIELLLNYCKRFYDRQFYTREHINKGLLEKFENLLNGYFHSERPEQEGLPTVAWCAAELNLSANYFGELIKKETGRSAQEYIHLKIMGLAKERVLDPARSVAEIAYKLGFKYPQHFIRFFKQQAGQTPNAYRTLIAN